MMDQQIIGILLGTAIVGLAIVMVVGVIAVYKDKNKK